MILVLTYIGAIILITNVIFIVAHLLNLFPERKIVGVAIKDNDLWVMSAPKRHGDLIRFMVDKGHKIPVVGEQGFVLDNGSFVSREKALKLAKKNGQFIFDCSPGSDQLFSENVW